MPLSAPDAYNGHLDGCRCRSWSPCKNNAPSYEHAVQAVIIEDTVVDAFCGCALFIDLPIGHLCHGGHLYKAGYPNRAGS